MYKCVVSWDLCGNSSSQLAPPLKAVRLAWSSGCWGRGARKSPAIPPMPVSEGPTPHFYSVASFLPCLAPWVDTHNICFIFSFGDIPLCFLSLSPTSQARFPLVWERRSTGHRGHRGAPGRRHVSLFPWIRSSPVTQTSLLRATSPHYMNFQ